MTETQLRAKIAYCEVLATKHMRLRRFFRDKVQEHRADLNRMTNPLEVIREVMRSPYIKYGPDCADPPS